MSGIAVKYKPQIVRDQESRQQCFPPDRLAFHYSAVSKDTMMFKAFERHEITLHMLCMEVAKNNYLDDYFPDGVPEDMMINELKIIGWIH